MKSKIIGLKRLEAKFKKLAQQEDSEIHKALKLGALLVEGTAKRSIQKSPASGRTYKTKSGTHTASSPGGPPRTDSGDLVSSIHSEVTGLEAVIGTDFDYGKYLEFGTQDMSARPWLFPALEQNKKRINKIIADAIRKAIRKVKK